MTEEQRFEQLIEDERIKNVTTLLKKIDENEVHFQDPNIQAILEELSSSEKKFYKWVSLADSLPRGSKLFKLLVKVHKLGMMGHENYQKIYGDTVDKDTEVRDKLYEDTPFDKLDVDQAFFD
jgi:hypothetical protein